MDERTKLPTLSEAVRESPITINERTLRRGIQRGELEAVLVRGKFRLLPESLAKFLQGQPAARRL